MQTIKLKLKRPLPWQKKVMSERARFNVVCIGRRAGKTELGKLLLCEPDAIQSFSAWFSPTYKDMLDVWRDIVSTLQPIIKRANATERRIELITGGVIEFWSLDNPNAGRGRRYKRIIIDEAAFIRHLLDAWNMALFPTLADFQGDAWIFSTPKGRNGFYHLWRKSRSNDSWRSWQMPTTVNPYIAQSEIDQMKTSMPERVFNQEINAVFLEDGGGVFRNVRGCVDSSVWQDDPPDLHGQYIFGVDWGKHNDFTVITVIDTQSKHVVHVLRFNQIDYHLQRKKLKELYDTFRPFSIYAESNSIGEPNIEELQRDGLPVIPFTTTNASKTHAVESLVLAFERGEITIPDYDIMIEELEAMEMRRTKTGMASYQAPDNFHDDCVMSLAIAWHAVADSWLMI